MHKILHPITNCKAPVTSVHLIFDALDYHNHFSFAAFDDDAKDHTKDVTKKEPMKIFLRIRPFLPKEITNKEDQGTCYW